MARWFDENFVKFYDGSFSKDLEKFGKEYQEIKSVEKLPEFIKSLFNFYSKETTSNNDKILINMLEPSFIRISLFNDEERKIWFEEYYNAANGIDERSFLAKCLKNISHIQFRSIVLFDDNELIDFDTDNLISEKELRKNKQQIKEEEDNGQEKSKEKELEKEDKPVKEFN